MFSTNFNSVVSLLLTPQPAVNAGVPTPQRILRIGIVSRPLGQRFGLGVRQRDDRAGSQPGDRLAGAPELAAQGFQVDLLQEFDPRLSGYRATALVSIHNDSCDYINEQATGFKVASAVASRDPNLSTRLVACIRDRYGRVTGLPFHPAASPPT